MSPKGVWFHDVGSGDDKVTVLEWIPRQGVLYLRWRRGGNWKWESLKARALAAGYVNGQLRDAKGRKLAGRDLKAKQAWAIAQAEAKFVALRTRQGKPATPDVPLTLGATWPILIDPETGPYPVDTLHRREVKRALDDASRLLGADQAWGAMTIEAYTRLWRSRIREVAEKQGRGLRAAEITVGRVLTVASALRMRGKIPQAAAFLDKSWKAQLRRDWRTITNAREDYEPVRPRYTLEEMLRLIAKAPQVDPRYALLLQLGAEQRLGVVLRARRPDLDLAHGTFRVGRRGHKHGTLVHLTKGQRAAVDRALDPETGYLRALEAGSDPDYPLFPGAPLSLPDQETPFIATGSAGAARSMSRETAMDWHTAAEVLAEIPHMKRRGWYGMRRTAVDEAKRRGISREGLQAFGGWTDTKTPDTIYASKDQDYARSEAADIRAQLRGEPSE